MMKSWVDFSFLLLQIMMECIIVYMCHFIFWLCDFPRNEITDSKVTEYGLYNFVRGGQVLPFFNHSPSVYENVSFITFFQKEYAIRSFMFCCSDK